ncbi:hypothetical protein ACOSQ3_010510 [Xanthoceras sorbifolium]
MELHYRLSGVSPGGWGVGFPPEIVERWAVGCQKDKRGAIIFTLFIRKVTAAPNTPFFLYIPFGLSLFKGDSRQPLCAAPFGKTGQFFVSLSHSINNRQLL